MERIPLVAAVPLDSANIIDMADIQNNDNVPPGTQEVRPATNGMKPSSDGQSWSAVIGIIIIVLVLVLGGAYFLLAQNNAASPAPDVGAGQA